MRQTTNQTAEQALAVQTACESIATMLAEAKALLRCCEAIANENGISFSYESFYEDISGNNNVDWNSSNCY